MICQNCLPVLEQHKKFLNALKKIQDICDITNLTGSSSTLTKINGIVDMTLRGYDI